MLRINIAGQEHSINNKETINDDLYPVVHEYKFHDEDDAVFILDQEGYYVVLLCVLSNKGDWNSLFEFETTKNLFIRNMDDKSVVLAERGTEKKYLFRYRDVTGWKLIDELLK